jgi:hypothetical protein
VLNKFKERSKGQFLIRTTNTVEIENAQKPALVADWLGLFVRGRADAEASSLSSRKV